jgi:hypothetical protein
MNKRNPYARSLRCHRAVVIPCKREKTYREHLDDTIREGVPEQFQRLLDELE